MSQNMHLHSLYVYDKLYVWALENYIYTTNLFN